MADRSITCYSQPSLAKSWVAIIFPIAAIIVAIAILIEKGHSLPLGYIDLVISGELPVFSQVIFWGSIIGWMYLFWPPAFEICFSKKKCILRFDGSTIVLISRRKIDPKLISKFYLHSKYIKREVIFLLSDGSRIDQSILFSRESYISIERQLNSLIEDWRDGGCGNITPNSGGDVQPS